VDVDDMCDFVTDPRLQSATATEQKHVLTLV